MPTTSSARQLREFAVIALDKAFSLVANESYIWTFLTGKSVRYRFRAISFDEIMLTFKRNRHSNLMNFKTF